MSARVAAIGTPDASRGTTSRQPSPIGPSAFSRDLAIVGIAKPAFPRVIRAIPVFSHCWACKVHWILVVGQRHEFAGKIAGWPLRHHRGNHTAGIDRARGPARESVATQG